ncbi:MAG TPA: hemerythrin domain-containing protein [Polyangiaceae bacterium]|nr:hemerythrin domain-containing protein [Polyangiaceae bacterium]
MDAIDYLVKQHRQLEEAFEAALNATDAERGALFGRAADVLMSHVLIEEEQFYPAVKARRTEDILLESLEEHLSLKRLLADLLELSPADPRFEAKLHVLKEQAEHHHKEEEEHLFPKVRKCLDRPGLEGLGRAMQAAQEEMLRGSPRERARQQTAAAAPL